MGPSDQAETGQPERPPCGGSRWGLWARQTAGAGGGSGGEFSHISEPPVWNEIPVKTLHTEAQRSFLVGEQMDVPGGGGVCDIPDSTGTGHRSSVLRALPGLGPCVSSFGWP